MKPPAIAFGPGGSHCEKPPLARDTLQAMGATVAETDTGLRDEISYRARHQHFAGLGECADSRPDVDAKAGKVVAHEFAFAAVNAGAAHGSARRGLHCRPLNVESSR